MRVTLSAQLLDTLGRDIVLGRYEGRPFPTEGEIARQFSISRSVTREAIKMLTSKGMLLGRPKRGLVIQPQSSWSFLDSDVLRWMMERKFSLPLLRHYTELRRAIEPAAAGLAAVHHDASSVTRISHELSRVEAAERGEGDALAADIAFHVSILEATRNPYFIQFSGLIDASLRVSLRFTNRVKGQCASVRAHRAVLMAIRARKSREAQDAMTVIIDEVIGLIEMAGEGNHMSE